MKPSSDSGLVVGAGRASSSLTPSTFRISPMRWASRKFIKASRSDFGARDTVISLGMPECLYESTRPPHEAGHQNRKLPQRGRRQCLRVTSSVAAPTTGSHELRHQSGSRYRTMGTSAPPMS
jgi:hypothetical protein